MKKGLIVKSAIISFLAAICIGCFVGASSTANKTTLAGSYSVGSCYLQTDSRWTNYSVNGGKLGANGCAIFSLVNGVNTYRTIGDIGGTAYNIMKHAAELGAFSGSGTSVIIYMPYFEERFGPEFGVIGGYRNYMVDGKIANLDALKEHVSKDRNFAVINVRNDHWGSYAPHAMAVIGYDYSADRFTVHDSAYGTTYSMATSYIMNTRILENYHLFRVQDGLELATRENKVLSSPTMGSWDTASNYYKTDANFANRKVAVTDTNSDYSIPFSQSSTNMSLEATFKITGKKSAEEYGKFGINLLDGSGNGLWIFADALGRSGETGVSSITGTNLCIVRNDGSGWQWPEKVLKENAFKADTAFSLKLVRNGINLDLYLNGEHIALIDISSYGIDMDETATASIFGWAILFEVTNYSSSHIQGPITIDGDFSDWEKVGWNKFTLNSTLQTITDINDPSKNVTFYYQRTSRGLYVYAIAKHHVNVTGSGDWWKNTNFEMYIDGTCGKFRQYYANYKEVRGFENFYFNTTGTSGNYTTILEGFVNAKHVDAKYVAGFEYMGYAFKVDNGAGTVDQIQINETSNPTSYWVPYNLAPTNLPITEYDKSVLSIDSIATPIKQNFKPLSQTTNTAHVYKNGEELVFDTAQDNGFYIYETPIDKSNRVNATFKLTGKLNDETYGKIGLKYVNAKRNGFYFYADASGSTGTGVGSITGTTFGVVLIKDGNADWNSSSTIGAINHASAVFSANSPFTMSVEYNATNSKYSLLVNNVVVKTISGSTYSLYSGEKYMPCPCIYSNQVSAVVTNYGIEKTAIDNLVADSNLSDWKALSDWNSIDKSKVGLYDDNNKNKGATFYYRLTANGLHIAVEANHTNKPGTNWAEWWNNTNVEMFIGVSSWYNQFYATEILTQGFNSSSFVTKYNDSLSLYTTIFEGFISNDVLTQMCGYDGNSIKLGIAFKSNENITTDGTTTDYWCAEKLDPRSLNIEVTQSHECEFGSDYVTDATHHWHICKTCNAASEKTEHSFTVKNQKYLASSATCTSKAKYYYTCECGQKGTTTYEYGNLAEHNYVWQEEIPAKQGVEGTVGHYHCDKCNGNFDSNKQPITNLVIPALPVASSSFSKTQTSTINSTNVSTKSSSSVVSNSPSSLPSSTNKTSSSSNITSSKTASTTSTSSEKPKTSSSKKSYTSTQTNKKSGCFGSVSYGNFALIFVALGAILVLKRIIKRHKNTKR